MVGQRMKLQSNGKKKYAKSSTFRASLSQLDPNYKTNMRDHESTISDNLINTQLHRSLL
jgi:hypothetical protein